MSKKLIGYICILLVIIPIIILQTTSPVSAASLSIYGCNHSPGSVEPGTSVTISCTVSESGMVYLSVTAYWRVNGGSLNSVTMSGSGSTYSASIGSFSSGDFVEYFGRAIGEDGSVLYSDRDPYSGYKSFTTLIAYEISWITPANSATIAIPYGSNPYTFNFDWIYSSIDYAKLELNGHPFDILTGGVKDTSVSFSYHADYDGSITATIIGFDGGVEKNSATRTFTFIWLPEFSVDLLYPAGGEKRENEVPINWDVNTAPQTIFSSKLEYSEDSGGTWHEIVNGLTQTTYLWDTTTLPYNWKYRIRVTITGTYLGQSLPETSESSLGDFTINPDTEGPDIINSGNKAFFVGNSGNFLTWTMFDRNAANYSVLQNGSYILEDIVWSDGTTVNISVDGLGLGHYVYTLIAEDSWGYQSVDILYVDVVVPSLSVSLLNPLGSAALENEILIEWAVITDPDTTYVSDLFFSNNSGISWYEIASGLGETSYLWNTSTFPTGTGYRIRVNVTGDYNNQSLGTVVDYSSADFSIDPDIEVPMNTGLSNVTYIFGKTGNYLTWNLSDRNPGNYSVLRNNISIIENIMWNNGQLVNITVDGLLPGYYEYTLISQDSWGYQTEDTLYVDVILPNMSVSLLTPNSTLTFENEVMIEWAVNTDAQTVYSTALEYSNDSGFTWYEIISSLNKTSYRWNSSLLANGSSYRIRVIVSGNYLNQSLGTVIDSSSNDFVLNPDTVAPLVSGLNNITYIFGNAGYYLTWMLSDRNPYTFSVLRNNSIIIDNITWEDNQALNISVNGLNPGYYEYKLISEDIWGNKSENMLYVNVLPDIYAPAVTNPDDLIIELGSTGNILMWTLTDDNPFNYSITQNGELIIIDEQWINNETIDFSLDYLSVGSFNLVITVQDALGQQTTDLVLVQVKDTIVPLISILSPVNGSNFIITESLISITYSYSASDMSNFIVDIFLNKTQISDTGKLDNLSPGFYLLNATAIDDYNNMNSSFIEFTITKRQDSSVSPTTSNSSDFFGDFSFIGPELLLIGVLAFSGLGSALIVPKIVPNLSPKKKISNLVVGNKKLPPTDPFALESLIDDDFLN